jgi:hypothetical protein
MGLIMSQNYSITKLFNFDKATVHANEPFSIKNTNSLENVLYKTTGIGLQNSNKLSTLKKTDTYRTLSRAGSTGNAPNNTSTQPVGYIFADDVYANLEQISAKEARDIHNDTPK